jgi:hypothetical protein
MKRCQWDARIELVCINLGESATVDGGKVIEKPAAAAALAALKARQEAVQLWVRGRLAILNLPRICRTCRICPRRDRFGIPFDKLRTGFGDQLGPCRTLRRWRFCVLAVKTSHEVS